MSMNITVCCDRCGGYLFRTLTEIELREKKTIHFLEHYIINDDGRPEYLCSSCYASWLKIKNKEA